MPASPRPYDVVIGRREKRVSECGDSSRFKLHFERPFSVGHRPTAFETRVFEPTTAPLHLVGIESAAHIGHFCKISHQTSEDSIMREGGERDEKLLLIGQWLLPNIHIEIGID